MRTKLIFQLSNSTYLSFLASISTSLPPVIMAFKEQLTIRKFAPVLISLGIKIKFGFLSAIFITTKSPLSIPPLQPVCYINPWIRFSSQAILHISLAIALASTSFHGRDLSQTTIYLPLPMLHTAIAASSSWPYTPHERLCQLPWQKHGKFYSAFGTLSCTNIMYMYL